ncbi:bifunctional endo-1,4-beta-xylanase XylA-like [Salvia divinorum]|uniref:Bifunctional endo-1,4-beta-xylanase XylA-like n=1 Tax=Salvia divinorum TaxID=28513 RepID=A0ABD1GYW0_SALDI
MRHRNNPKIGWRRGWTNWRKLLYLPWKRPSRQLRLRSAKRHVVQRSRINFTIPSPKENTPRRWSDADLNQPALQMQNFPNRGDGPSSWASRNSKGTHQLGNQGPNGNENWSSDNQPNWSGRYQQGHPADSYIPPQQRGFQGGASQPPQGSAPQGRYNQAAGSSGNFHPQGQGYNHYQNQQGNPHFNQGHGCNQSASGSGQLFQRPQQKPINDMVGNLFNTQQYLQNNMQTNNDMVHKLQDAQREQKAAIDMIAQQLSQIATSLNEIRGNEGRTRATVRIPDKENISQLILRSGKA